MSDDDATADPDDVTAGPDDATADPDDRTGESGDPEATEQDPGPYPIEGTALVKTAALASVPAAQVPALLTRVQADLGSRIDAYRRRYERIAAEAERETFLVEPEHWEAVADRVGLTERERDAVVRAHEAAVERIGAGSGRREEFDTALEIRSGVVIGLEEEDGDRDTDAEEDRAEATEEDRAEATEEDRAEATEEDRDAGSNGD